MIPSYEPPFWRVLESPVRWKVGAVGAAGNRRLLASAGVFIAGFAVSAIWPGVVWEVFALTCAAGMLSEGWSWSRRRVRRRIPS